jgi:hypothetical protein
MSLTNYLTAAPLTPPIRSGARPGSDCVRFVGTPKKHPYDDAKCILLTDPLSSEPTILEFKIEDITFVDEAVASVNERGESVELVALYIRKGCIGIQYQAFEVDDPIKPISATNASKKR